MESVAQSLGVPVHLFTAMMNERAKAFIVPEGRPFNGQQKRLKA
jgi:hypothetical protein